MLKKSVYFSKILGPTSRAYLNEINGSISINNSLHTLPDKDLAADNTILQHRQEMARVWPFSIYLNLLPNALFTVSGH